MCGGRRGKKEGGGRGRRRARRRGEEEGEEGGRRWEEVAHTHDDIRLFVHIELRMRSQTIERSLNS